ncbi:MAG TPA: outer membrane beta-barrel protein [Bradyrhizobium sp.]|nr:outer membrane beta-barrel protein [Bradyrhizobium sp.]
MKKVLLTTVGLVALGMAPALAADLPARAYTKAPVAAAAIYNWGGFYIGLNGGGGSSHKCWNLTSVPGVAAFAPTNEGCHDATGGLVGGQLGYRWQAANWVFGLEAQGDWANLKGSNTSQGGTLGGLPYVNQTKIDAIGLFTGQVGYAWNNVLLYLKGGAAFTHDKYNGLTTGAVGGVPANTAFDQASETRWGGAVGAGLEFGFAPGWSVGVEYDHLFMGNRSLNLTATAVAGGGLSRTDSIKQDVDIGTVRLNYTFGGPVVAKY